MLDNLDNNTTMAATNNMPIEILADAKQQHMKNKQQQQDKLQNNNNNTATLTKTNKTKTILNWLKNTTSLTKNHHNNNYNNINNNTTTTATATATIDDLQINANNHNRFDKVTTENKPATDEIEEKLATPPTLVNECTCPTVKQQNSTRSNKSLLLISSNSNNNNGNNTPNKDYDTLREFRGVQTLKHFWNKRITANRESALRSKKGLKTKQFTKSVSCLVNSINNIEGEPPPLTEEERLKVRKLRALSLHDCSHLSRDEEEDNIEFEEINLTDLEIQKHLEKDNFYKYKTAEQALKLRELSENSNTRRCISNGIILPKTERFQWLKRHDIFSKRKAIEETSHSSDNTINIMRTPLNNNVKLLNNVNPQFISHTHNELPSLAKDHDDIVDDNTIIINDYNKMHSSRDTMTLPTAISQYNNEVGNTNTGSESSTPTLTATNSPQHAISRGSLINRKDSAKTLASAGSISRDSSTASLANSGKVRRSSSTRKYSFKTHSRSYHAPRKMHTNKDHTKVSSTAVDATNLPTNSLVAKLTQQFNEIIQKDKTLLEEIKRKNGVIMKHKGHVYKVVDTSSLNRNQSPSISRSSSRAQERNLNEKSSDNVRSSSSSTVQKNIKKFESESRGLKPKIPLKSIKVLNKSNELVVINKLGVNPLNTNRSSSSSVTQKDVVNNSNTEIKPQTLNINSTLEMVKEESKTPVDGKEGAIEQPTMNSLKSAEVEIDILRIKPPKIDSVVYKNLRRSQEKYRVQSENEVKARIEETINCAINSEANAENDLCKNLEETKDLEYIGDSKETPRMTTKSETSFSHQQSSMEEESELKYSSNSCSANTHPSIETVQPKEQRSGSIYFSPQDNSSIEEGNGIKNYFSPYKQESTEVRIYKDSSNSYSPHKQSSTEQGIYKDSSGEQRTNSNSSNSYSPYKQTSIENVSLKEEEGTTNNNLTRELGSEIGKSSFLYKQLSRDQGAEINHSNPYASLKQASSEVSVFLSPDKQSSREQGIESTTSSPHKPTSIEQESEIMNSYSTHKPTLIEQGSEISTNSSSSIEQKSVIKSSPSPFDQSTNRESNLILSKEKNSVSCSSIQTKLSKEMEVAGTERQFVLDNENKENQISAGENNQNTQLQVDKIKQFPRIQQEQHKQSQISLTEEYNKETLSSSTTPTSNEHIESQESKEDEDEKRKRKHKYAKIYEKLRFFAPFSNNKKPKSTAASPTASESSKYEDLSPVKTKGYTPMISPTPSLKKRHDSEGIYSEMFNPESKILDALEEVDKKIQHLNEDKKQENETTNLVLLESDEYGQPVTANSSFLHHTYTKDITPKAATLIQAVNVTLVNAIEGEQMIMEQKEILKQQDQKEEEDEKQQLHIEPDLLSLEADEEPLYEPICTTKIQELKTENYKNPTSISRQIPDTVSSTKTEEIDIIEEDIYQTVEEVKKEYSPETIRNSKSELDGYEPIENPDVTTLLTLKCYTTLPKVIHFDGYEECSPPVETTPVTTPYTLGVRKVTDELPDLPQPKRKLSKSPMPLPLPPLPQKPTEKEKHIDNGLITPCLDSPFDYGPNDHCYESVQSVGNKLQKCPPSSQNTKNPDCVSLSSNCYESISHFKRPNMSIGHHHSGSSNGSTLTISSENKTNSLYEDSLGSMLHYSSKRIYRPNIHTTNSNIEINKMSDVGSINGVGYGGSIGRRSDTSDEWTDVTDNENDGVEKPQFIIVRERSKAHKSPDWSRRVRDKRQRKSKSCIEEDDPYYEQISPQALTKRHSLLDQTCTNSLQRNQDEIRVSKRGKKMSYSAHALGQHISDDSFDSDTDDYYEKNFKNSHNDSGVDIRQTKLPEPPAASNQMYSIVKKFKNFIVNKKSPNSSKLEGSQQKIYDNTSQFYTSTQYEGRKSSSTLQVPETKELSTSEKNLIMAQSTVSKPEALNTSTTPRKSKSGKSLRSRLRKSLVGFDNKQLSTTLTPTRSTFYIEDPQQDNINEQLDSGFSEKALSGDLPTTAASTPASAESHKFSTLARKSKKEAKLANSQRRRTTIGSIRPHEPPPPPPPSDAANTKRQSNTSWYAECGVFKNGTTNLVHDDSQILNSQTGGSGSSFTAGSTWYEEAGLYQTSGISVASSSGSSGVSTSNEAGPADEMSHSMFSNEPLYQIYSAAKLEAISRDMQDESSADGYEEIGNRQKNGNATEECRKSARPSALQLIEPKGGPERTLWSQIPEVINSYIIPTMTQRERALMEAKFEVITSEASYLKSLNLLRTHYMNHPIFRDQNIVSSRDRKFLFAHIVPVHECSEKLLTELESCWQDNIMLVGLSKRIYAIAEKHFHVYIGFCEHQGRMDRTLKHLRESRGLFSQNLELLESSPSCCGLNLHSFLMLPMQRITRLPLLIDAVFSKCHPNDDEYENWKMCLAIMNKIVTQCNEAANKSEQAFEIERISRQLEFNHSSIRPLAIAPAGVLAPGTKPRYLVKKGELTHLIWRGDDAKLTFGKKFSKTTIFAFLFSDLLVLTKRKAEEHFSVFDYCPRNMLTITSGDSLPQLPTKDLNSQTSKNLILMTLLENHERKTVELLLSCPSVSEQERWLQAMRPPESETPGEKLYEQWDCPQVIAKHLYENNEPDVLNLEVGDVVNVTRKLPDGWYKGERIRDGAVGWFPGSYTEEVNSVHVRARNLKQRHRLLTFTATYLESQKRNK